MKSIKTRCASLRIIPLVLGLAALAMPSVGHADSHVVAAPNGTIHITKSPTCGCCTAWAALARQHGYKVETTDTADITRVKVDANLPNNLWACHTAMINGYIIEGHVPFAALANLLKDKPDIIGIAVPGMPSGAPGMGDDPSARYDVVAFGGDAAVGEIYFQAGL